MGTLFNATASRLPRGNYIPIVPSYVVYIGKRRSGRQVTPAAKRVVRRHPHAGDAIHAALQLLAEDAFDPRLQTHKLKDSLAGCWASSDGYDLRIVFEFVSQSGHEAILLLSVGTHDEVY